MDLEMLERKGEAQERIFQEPRRMGQVSKLNSLNLRRNTKKLGISCKLC